MDVTARETGDAETDWRSRVVPTPQGQVSSSRQGARATVAKVQGSPRRARISLKPLRRESRMPPLHLYARVPLYLYPIAHEAAGAARTRLSLRPLNLEGEELIASLGRTAPRDREAALMTMRQLLIRLGKLPIRVERAASSDRVRAINRGMT